MVEIAIAGLSLVIWLYLLIARGQFWRTDQRLTEDVSPPSKVPSVAIVVPARNEADMLPISLRSLLSQDYPGDFFCVVVDDHSTDQTAAIAQQIAQDYQQNQQPDVPPGDRFTLLSAKPLPPGWTGKLWALDQGVRYAIQQWQPDYLLLTDADIQHSPQNLHRLIHRAVGDRREMVSLMVRLRCQSGWEKLLIPAFVFFFAKLYPFRWVNHPKRKLGAAAGGCSLIQRSALERIGGIAAIKDALIDDCTLAQTIKSSIPESSPSNKIWLGLATQTYSLRPYDGLEPIWNMVARTAYTQLNYSPLLLVGTLAGMAIVYLLPVVALMWGIVTGNLALVGISGLTYILMVLSYLPMIQFYQLSPLWSLCLPAIALLYTLMTIDSARRHWQGMGGAWKGRTY
ncbi:MAG: glycosyltransferase [Synechococcales bacterium]|nr:glycosyltransferase [Synechococcales bacterium]